MTVDTNPYSPPESEVSDAVLDSPLVAASKGRRLGTFVVDYIGFMTVGFLIGAVTAIVLGEAGLQSMQRIPDFLLGSLIYLSYYLVFEGLWGRTPGKLLFGTRVVNEAGGKASFLQVLGRTVCRFIPFEAFTCLGERGLHDRLPKTRVVMARSS